LHFFGKGIETHIGPENNSGDLTGIRQFMSEKVKILVVDDQMAVAMMMVFLLTRAGCEVESALTAEKALRLAQAEAFDLITLDIDLPGLNGFDLFQSLKKIPQVRDTPIIFVSGNTTIENQQRGLDLGAVDFIEKPFDALNFASRLLAHVNRQSEFA
jgi:DNA-binding response OmpR family regulator